MKIEVIKVDTPTRVMKGMWSQLPDGRYLYTRDKDVDTHNEFIESYYGQEEHF